MCHALLHDPAFLSDCSPGLMPSSPPRRAERLPVPRHEYAEHSIVSPSSVPFPSICDLIQLFALSALALLISVLGALVLAVVLMMLPFAFAFGSLR